MDVTKLLLGRNLGSPSFQHAIPGGEKIEHSAFIWSVADLLRGDYKQSEYGTGPKPHSAPL